MCKMNEYPGLYARATELLRHEGINQEMPGFGLLRAAIVISKVEGIDNLERFKESRRILINLNGTARKRWKAKTNRKRTWRPKIKRKPTEEIGQKTIFQKIEDNMLVPNIKPVITKKSPAEQWIAEAIRSIGVKVSAKEFIADMVYKL